VLCGSTGANTSSTGLTQLGSCTLPANFLAAGDRVEIRFDYSHEGAGTGFSFQLNWGATVLVSRSPDRSRPWFRAEWTRRPLEWPAVERSELGRHAHHAIAAAATNESLTAPLTISSWAR